MRKYLNIRFIWRINAILILAIGAGTCVLFLYGAFSIVSSWFGPRRVENVVRTEQGVHEDWDLGRFDAIPGAGFVVAPASSRQTYTIGSLGKEATAVRNYLFVNPTDLTAHWLLADQNSIVLALERFGAKGPLPVTDEKATPVRWLLVTRVASDTNGDHAITGSDRQTISVAQPDGAHLRDVLSDVENVVGSTWREDGRLILIYTAKGQTSIAAIDLDAAKVLETKPLPRPGV